MVGVIDDGVPKHRQAPGPKPVADCVYADSTLALAQARAAGLPAQVPVRTFSPALARLCPEAEPADAAIDAAGIRALEEAALALSEGLRAALWDEDQDLATAAGRACFNQLHVLLLKAACLREEDFTRPVAVIETRTGVATFDDMFASVLPELLSVNAALEVVTVDAAALELGADPQPPPASLRQRLRFAGPASLLFRLGERLGSRIGLRGPRGSILVLRENELVKETATALMLRGFAIRDLPRPDPRHDPLPDRTVATVEGVIDTAFEGDFSRLLVPSACAAVQRMVRGYLLADLGRYRGAVVGWRAQLDRLAPARPRAVLSNFLSTPDFAALHAVTRQRNIPLIVAQHGVTMEIHARQARYAAIHETTAADLALLFNAESVAVAEASAFAQARAIAVGLPADYVRGTRLRSMPDAPPVWYVGTALYLGNRGMLFEGVPDRIKADFETAMVERVLSALPHKVLYKPYPARRFLDEAPEIAAARRAANVTLLEERLDLRYLIGSARVLVVSRAYSTPSWCLMTGRPVVFVDIPGQAALRDEARAAFAEGTFLFDAGAPDFHDALRAFLSLPIAEIEDRYRAKAPGRERLIARFVTAHGARGAGRRAARAVMRAIAEAGA